jgi:dinuclear metal center YbgI/SA1388 family protein
MKCKDIIAFLEQKAPLYLQESYDNSGLQWGNPDSHVQKVLVCLDFTQEALEKAKKEKVQMVISHHPIMFRPMKSIHTGYGKGGMLADCIREEICVYAAHTNYDVAQNGLNDYLARALELQDIKGLKTHYRETFFKLVVFIPEDSFEKVQNALYESGAGWIGNYSDCGFSTKGNGTFRPHEGTNPYIGRTGKLETVQEIRLETIIPQNRIAGAVQSMLRVHPYEEVAYDIYRLEQPGIEYSLGRTGNLTKSLSENEFVELVKEKLQVKNVRTSGTASQISCVAVFCGSFDGDVKALKFKRVDALVTGDLKYHDAQELAEAGIFTVDAGHYHTEKMFIKGISEVLKDRFHDVIIFEHYGQDIFQSR